MALLHVNFFSETLGMAMPMDVILPEKADAPYPTLYLLHGMSDDQTVWQRRTSIERYAADKGLAVVMPTTHLGWYTDMRHGLKYFTFVSKEVVEISRRLFPGMSPKREDTFVSGLSMGGYGALKLGLLAPETFSYAAPLSGALDIGQNFQNPPPADNDARVELFTNVFGTPEEFFGSDNDLMAAAERLAKSGKPKPEIYIWCGTEDFLYAQNTRMRDHLKKLGYSLKYEESPGDHTWGYWDEKIQTVLDWLPLKK